MKAKISKRYMVIISILTAVAAAVSVSGCGNQMSSVAETTAQSTSEEAQTEEETAQAEFQLESFSTFTISWNRRGTNNSTTTFGWQDRGGTARGYMTAQYTDESGNVITRPDGIGYTVYHGNFNNGAVDSFNILNELARPIQNYAFTGAYVSVDGAEQPVDSVTAI